MWQGILSDILGPLIIGLLLAIASGRREDMRQTRALMTPTYTALSSALAAAQNAETSVRAELSTLRDERDALHTQLGDWQDWGHDLTIHWDTVRLQTAPPPTPDRGTK